MQGRRRGQIRIRSCRVRVQSFRHGTLMPAPAITDVSVIRTHVPFRERVAPWNALLVGGFGLVDVYRVETEDPDVVGWGEQLHEETTGLESRPPLNAFRGRNPAELLGAEGLGLGLQAALYDVVGKTLGVPVYALFGRPRVREWVPLSWWNTKLPPELLAEEARDALREGYLAHKVKARPWFDVYEQVERISAVTPPHYAVDLDWNQLLLAVGDAAPVLRELERYERVAIFETPIRQRDLEGYRRLRDKVSLPVVEHFLETPFPQAVSAEAFDGFVAVGFSVTDLLRQGTLAAEFRKPFWLQAVGTGLTTALVLHLAAVLDHARWPSVTASNTYADDLLTEPLVVRAGCGRVPSAPGLGVTVDEAALDRYRVPDDYALPPVRRVLTFRLDGRQKHYASVGQLWQDCLRGNMPVQERGARLLVRDDDGCADFAELYARAVEAPVLERV